MDIGIDPLTSVSIILFQLGNRFLKINITKAQEEIIQLPVTQAIFYFIIIYGSTKKFFLSIFIASLSFVLYNYLLNENSPYNLFPDKWLNDKNIITKPSISYKENYKQNIQHLHL